MDENVTAVTPLDVPAAIEPPIVNAPVYPPIPEPTPPSQHSDFPYHRRGGMGKIIGSVIGLMLLAGGLFAGYKLVGLSQEKRSRASGSDVKFVMIASPTSVKPGDPYTVTFFMNSSSNYNISAISLPVAYSANTTYTGYTVESFFGQNYPKNSSSQTTDMLSIEDKTRNVIVNISLGAPCTTTAPRKCYPHIADGATKVLTLRFTAGSSTTAITHSIGSGVQVAAIGQGPTNVADTANLPALTISVQGPTAIATPTIGSTPTPTLTSTLRLANTPTPTPTSRFGRRSPIILQENR